MTSGHPDAMLAVLSAQYGGAFSFEHTRIAGLTPRQVAHRVNTELWERVLPTVYRHAATPLTPELMRHAALLCAGSASVASHRSAGAVWNLDDAVDKKKPEITIVGQAHPKHPAVKVHRTTTMPPLDMTVRDGLRVTRPARTIVDLASVLAEESLEFAFESARRLRIVTHEVVSTRLDRLGGRGRPGAARLRAVLAATEGQPPAESKLEVKTARLLRVAMLPPPVRQHGVTFFGKRYRLDFAWPELRVALECDSRKWHNFQSDRTRWRKLGASGWRILPVTWQDVTREWPTVLAELTAALSTAA